MSAQITPQLIKELRDKTGVGIGKCKEALAATNGDLEEAISNLRKAGMASAVKKEGRSTNEGMIAFAETNDRIAIVEVNAETDFVVKNDRFQEFLKNIAEEVAATNPDSIETLLTQKFSKDNSMTIDEYRGTVIQAIGENIQVRRLKTFDKGSNVSIGTYSHLGGKIGTVVLVEGSDKAADMASGIAMHVAASHPEYLNPEDVPSSIVEQEREIARTQLKGKPDNIIDKILEGKMGKYYDENCLVRQSYIRDDSVTITELVEKQGKELGAPLKVTGFIRWAVGQD